MQRGQEISDVVWIGLRGVGKTALIQQILGREFDATYHPTPAAETFLTSALNGYEVKLWDTCGTDSIATTDARVPPKDCLLILVYDVSDGYSFQYLEQCLPTLRNFRPMCPAVLVGTKADVTAQPVVPPGSARKLASKYLCDFVQTSAKAPDLFNCLLTTKLHEYSVGISMAAMNSKRSRCCLTACLSWIRELVWIKQAGDQREPMNSVRSSLPAVQKMLLTDDSSDEKAFDSNSTTEVVWHIANGVILSSYEFRNQSYVRVSRPESVVQAVYDGQQKFPWVAEQNAPGVCTVAELWHTMTESKLEALPPNDPYTRDTIDVLFMASIESLCNNMECITLQVTCEQPSLHACRIFWQLFVYLQFKAIPLWYDHANDYVTVTRAVPGLEAVELALESKGAQSTLNISWGHCATIRAYGLSLDSSRYKEFQQLAGWHMVEGGAVAGSGAAGSSRNAPAAQGSTAELNAPDPVRQQVPTAIEPHGPNPSEAIRAGPLELPTVLGVYTHSIHNDQHWIFAKVLCPNGRERAQDFPAAEFATLPEAEANCPAHIWDTIMTRRGTPANL